MSVERYIKQIVGDVMEMAAKIKFLEAKVAAAESWNAECTADAQAQLEAVRRERDKWEEIAGLRFAGDPKFVKEMELLKIENADLRSQLAHLQALVRGLPYQTGEITKLNVEVWTDGSVRKVQP